MFSTEVTTASSSLAPVETGSGSVPYCRLPPHLAAGLAPPAAEETTVTSVLRRYVPAYLAEHPERVTRHQWRVLDKLLNCRRPALGAHAWHCQWCGHTHLSYNGCGNRHCPSCGAGRRGEWLQRVLGWSLPTSYLHLVITQPHELTPLVLANRAALYGLLFRAANQALSEITREVYQAQPGWVIMLHSWGQVMLPHIHLHFVQTAGGLSLDGSAWVPMHADDEAFSKEHLGLRFRQRYVEGLVKLFRRQALQFPESLGWIDLEEDLQRWLAPIVAKPWHTHCQGPPPHCEGPDAALKYLARYVVGSAISDQRIVSDDGQYVVIRVKDYRTGEVQLLVLTGEEFVRRFLLHILPPRLHRLRYAGLFTSRFRDERLEICRQLLTWQESSPTLTREAEEDNEAEGFLEEETDETEQAPTGPTCPRCLMPGMQALGRLKSWEVNLLVLELRCLWARIITIVTTLPDDASGPRRAPDPLDDRGQWLTWTITTIEVNEVTFPCDSPPPDT